MTTTRRRRRAPGRTVRARAGGWAGWRRFGSQGHRQRIVAGDRDLASVSVASRVRCVAAAAATAAAWGTPGPVGLMALGRTRRAIPSTNARAYSNLSSMLSMLIDDGMLSSQVPTGITDLQHTGILTASQHQPNNPVRDVFERPRPSETGLTSFAAHDLPRGFVNMDTAKRAIRVLLSLSEPRRVIAESRPFATSKPSSLPSSTTTGRRRCASTYRKQSTTTTTRSTLQYGYLEKAICYSGTISSCYGSSTVKALLLRTVSSSC